MTRMTRISTRIARTFTTLTAALVLTITLSACDRLKVHGEGGSNSDPEVDIGIKF
jgi:hypothetical protein